MVVGVVVRSVSAVVLGVRVCQSYWGMRRRSLAASLGGTRSGVSDGVVLRIVRVHAILVYHEQDVLECERHPVYGVAYVTDAVHGRIQTHGRRACGTSRGRNVGGWRHGLSCRAQTRAEKKTESAHGLVDG